MTSLQKVGRQLSQTKLRRASDGTPPLVRSSSSTKVIAINPAVERLRGEGFNKSSSKLSVKGDSYTQSSFVNFQTLNERKDDIDSKTPEVTFSKITLRFPDKGLEDGFLEYYFKASLRKVRLGIILVLFFEVLVGLLDLAQKEDLGFSIVSKLLIIRYGAICPVFTILGAFTFSREFPKFMQVIALHNHFCSLVGCTLYV